MTDLATADIVERTLLDHDGRSGARLERVVLRDGTRLVVKSSDLVEDLAAQVSGDTSGRELELWRSGVLDDLPDGVGHCIVNASHDERGRVVTVMRDLGSHVIGWNRRLGARECGRILTAVAAVHRRFDGRAPAGLCPLWRYLTALAPGSVAPLEAGSNPLPRLIRRGWELAAELVPGDVWEATQRVFAAPMPLAAALEQQGTTLVHGDLWPVNVALEPATVTLLDWGLAVEAPGSVELAAFIAGVAGIADLGREAMVESYASAARVDPSDVRRALVVGFLQYGWNKALDAAEHPDPAIRSRERADLDWWVARAGDAFDALSAGC